MQLDYFGDTYDLAKRFLIERLAPDEPWAIVPMFTDQWNGEQIAEYERLLGGKVLRGECITGAPDWQQAVTAGDWHGHVFYDPNTGIRRPGVDQGSASHLKLDEVILEAGRRPLHITLVFDQSYANAKRDEKTKVMREKLAYLSEAGVYGLGYLCQAPFLILSLDKDAIGRARENLLDAGVPASRLIA